MAKAEDTHNNIATEKAIIIFFIVHLIKLKEWAHIFRYAPTKNYRQYALLVKQAGFFLPFFKFSKNLLMGSGINPSPDTWFNSTCDTAVVETSVKALN
jgi:hypothetical protein